MKHPIELKLELEDVTYIRDLLEINADLYNDRDDVKQSDRLAKEIHLQTYLRLSLPALNGRLRDSPPSFFTLNYGRLQKV